MRLNSTLEQFESDYPCTNKICREFISWMIKSACGENPTEESLDKFIVEGLDGINVHILYAIEKALEELEKLKMEQYL